MGPWLLAGRGVDERARTPCNAPCARRGNARGHAGASSVVNAGDARAALPERAAPDLRTRRRLRRGLAPRRRFVAQTTGHRWLSSPVWY